MPVYGNGIKLEAMVHRKGGIEKIKDDLWPDFIFSSWKKLGETRRHRGED